MTFRREGKGVKAIVEGLDGLDGLEGRTGWFENNVYPSGVPVAYIATIQEFGVAGTGAVRLENSGSKKHTAAAAGFGSSRIPPRPFMRPAVRDNGQAWIDLMASGARACLEGRFTPTDVLQGVADRAANDVGKKIQELTAPELAESTIAKKGFPKPLVHTGRMLQTVRGKVQAAGS